MRGAVTLVRVMYCGDCADVTDDKRIFHKLQVIHFINEYGCMANSRKKLFRLVLCLLIR